MRLSFPLKEVQWYEGEQYPKQGNLWDDMNTSEWLPYMNISNSMKVPKVTNITLF